MKFIIAVIAIALSSNICFSDESKITIEKSSKRYGDMEYSERRYLRTGKLILKNIVAKDIFSSEVMLDGKTILSVIHMKGEMAMSSSYPYGHLNFEMTKDGRIARVTVSDGRAGPIEMFDYKDHVFQPSDQSKLKEAKRQWKLANKLINTIVETKDAAKVQEVVDEIKHVPNEDDFEDDN